MSNLPEFKSGHTTVQLDNNDMKGLITLLVFAKEMFAEVAMLTAGKMSTAEDAINKSKLAGAFAQRFYDYLKSGEPENREKH